MSVPSSGIMVFSNVPLNNTYEHTIYFENAGDQMNYFYTKQVKSFSSFTYLEPGKVIKIAGDVANARQWNYLFIRNDSGKRYFHFINRVEYINDSAVKLYIELDVIQTYMFDWKLHQCFIERMHTTSDNFGEHTIPEGLETGPLIQHSSFEINLDENVILLLSTENPFGGATTGGVMNGVFSGLGVYAVLPESAETFADKLISDAVFSESIVSMWMYPKKLVRVDDSWTDTRWIHKVIGVDSNIDYIVADKISVGGDSIDYFPIKNRKTMCYPYTMMYVSNNMGGCAVYHRERFNDNDTHHFRLIGALSPDSGLQLVPANYKNKSGLYFEEALAHPPFPTCAWVSDTYKLWLAQNQNQLEFANNQAVISAGVGIATAAGSLLTGNVMGAGAGLLSAYHGVSTVLSQMAQKADVAIQPDQSRGNHSGNINLTHDRMGYTVYFMTITNEYAEQIDKYFSRYGYKVNIIDTPKIYTREVFTYVKTVGALVTGKFSAEDQLKIQAIFDKGVTFWAQPDKFGSFYVTNNPVSNPK